MLSITSVLKHRCVREKRAKRAESRRSNGRCLSGMGHGSDGEQLYAAQTLARRKQRGVARAYFDTRARDCNARRTRCVKRAHRSLAPAGDHRVLWRRHGRDRPYAGLRTRRSRHQHARCADRRRCRFRVCAHAGQFAQSGCRRRPRSVRSVAEKEFAARHESARENVGDHRIRAHRTRGCVPR